MTPPRDEPVNRVTYTTASGPLHAGALQGSSGCSPYPGACVYVLGDVRPPSKTLLRQLRCRARLEPWLKPSPRL